MKRWITRNWRRLGVSLLLIGALVLITGAVVLEMLVRRANLPEALLNDPRGNALQTPRLLDRHGEPLTVFPKDHAREAYPVALREISPWLRQTTVLVEDRRFEEHEGVDLAAIAAAAWRNARENRVVSGGSTITQQLIKISGPERPRSFGAKLDEALAALKLERHWNKDHVLEAYLNRLDYGNRRIGPEAAARAYFGKSAADLSFAEALYLAGLPQAPSRLNPWQNPRAAEARYRRNVKSLAEADLLPEGLTGEVLTAAPPRVLEEPPPFRAPHVAEMLRDQALPKSLGGDDISTTLDLRMQTVVEALLSEHLAEVATHGVGDAAVVVIHNDTGEIRALACSGRPDHAAINSALTPRSAGSTLKPFLYAQALASREITAATLLPDTPDAVSEAYQDYDPQNYTGRFHGPVRVREALANSLNVPAIVTLHRMGERPMYARLQDWGLQFPGEFAEFGAGFVLGNAPVRLLDLATAYAGLARGGLVWPARLTGEDGPGEIRQMATREACAIIADILADPDARRMSFGTASPLNLTHRAAVKTGTSSGFRDGWCAGFNSDHTVAVWAGNLNGRPMDEMLAVRAAAPLWAATMQYLFSQGDDPWPVLEGSPQVVRCEIDARTGLLPRPGDPTLSEAFLPGTEPRANAASFYDETGQLLLPAQYAAWCASPHNHLGATVREDFLRIVFPRDGAVFSINPHMDRAQQVLVARATEEEDVRWSLNGEELPNHRLPLKPGQWRLTAQTGKAQATVNFLVE